MDLQEARAIFDKSFLKEDLDEKIALLEQIKYSDENLIEVFAEAQNLLGYYLEKRGSLIKLLNIIEKYLKKIIVQYAKAQLWLGMLLFKKGDNFNGMLAYHKVPKEIPEVYSSAQFFIGIEYELNQQYDLAIDAYKNSLETSPNYARAQFRLGKIYERRGCLKNAEYFYKNIKIEHNLEVYAESQFLLGSLEDNLEEKSKFWMSIPSQSDQYRKESYKINIVKSIVELEGNKLKDELYKIFEMVNQTLKKIIC